MLCDGLGVQARRQWRRGRDIIIAAAIIAVTLHLQLELVRFDPGTTSEAGAFPELLLRFDMRRGGGYGPGIDIVEIAGN